VLNEFPRGLMSMLYSELFGAAFYNADRMSTNFENDESSHEVSANNMLVLGMLYYN
jgi:hypothetical protein